VLLLSFVLTLSSLEQVTEWLEKFERVPGPYVVEILKHAKNGKELAALTRVQLKVFMPEKSDTSMHHNHTVHAPFSLLFSSQPGLRHPVGHLLSHHQVHRDAAPEPHV
jgi:hypothetical protein